MYFRAMEALDTCHSVVSAGVEASTHSDLTGCVRIKDPITEKPISIRLADTDGYRNAARILLKRRYSWRGYGDGHTIAQSPSHTTFTASAHDEVVGTITLVTDSVGGLAADVLYKDVIDDFRSRPGARVCELSRFVFESATSSPAILASMFHLIFIYGTREHGCTDLFIEVTPRHAKFYEAMLGFKKVGDVKHNSTVSVAGQLLWISIAQIRSNIDREAGDTLGRSRSLYRYFFSPREELGLYARMTASRESSQVQATVDRSRGVIRFDARLTDHLKDLSKEATPSDDISEKPEATKSGSWYHLERTNLSGFRSGHLENQPGAILS